MNKSKVLMSVLAIFAILAFAFLSFTPSIFAEGVDPNFPQKTQGSISTIDNAANKVWGTVLTVAQILAFAAVVFAGVRYMFASADQKADIKQGLIYLVIGAILVFAASTVVKVILNAADELAPADDAASAPVVVQEITNLDIDYLA